MLAALLLVVDVLGGLTPLWANERVRVGVARVRLPFDFLVLLTWLVLETGVLSGAWLANRMCMRVAPTALSVVTLGGAIAAIVCQLRERTSEDWIFAIESLGVLLLLLLWACYARPFGQQVLEEEAALREGSSAG